MSRSVNVVFILGNLGAEPEVKTAGNGTKVAKLSVATSRPTKAETTDWHRVTCFDKTAEIVELYAHKGDRIHIEGRIEYSETEKDGVKRHWTDIIANRVTLLGSGKAAVTPATTAPFADDDDLPF